MEATSALFAVWGRKRTLVESVEDAQQKWDAFRRESMAGCSEIGNGLRVVDAKGKFVARISYNGRIWNTP